MDKIRAFDLEDFLRGDVCREGVQVEAVPMDDGTWNVEIAVEGVTYYLIEEASSTEG